MKLKTSWCRPSLRQEIVGGHCMSMPDGFQFKCNLKWEVLKENNLQWPKNDTLYKSVICSRTFQGDKVSI